MNLSPRGATTHYHRLVDLQRNEVLTVPPKAGNPTSGYHKPSGVSDQYTYQKGPSTS